jgi:hypothetical protein
MLNEARDPKLDDAVRCSEISTTSSDGRVDKDGVSGMVSGDIAVVDMLSSHLAFRTKAKSTSRRDANVDQVQQGLAVDRLSLNMPTSSSHVTVVPLK